MSFERSQSSDKENGSYTEKYQDHIPCSFAYKVVSQPAFTTPMASFWCLYC